jgi:hypothetical protein
VPQAGAEEVVLAFPATVSQIRHVRSTVLLGSLGALDKAGHRERWAAQMPSEACEAVQYAVPGVWMRIEIGLAHYRACEQLGLSDDDAAQMGASTFARIKGTLLGTMLRMAQGAAVTPWTVLPHLQRFWNRAYDGAGIRILWTGPKDARLDLAQCALADNAYYRPALGGLLRSVIELFAARVYVREHRGRRPPGTVSLHAQWA